MITDKVWGCSVGTNYSIPRGSLWIWDIGFAHCISNSLSKPSPLHIQLCLSLSKPLPRQRFKWAVNKASAAAHIALKAKSPNGYTHEEHRFHGQHPGGGGGFVWTPFLYHTFFYWRSFWDFKELITPWRWFNFIENNILTWRLQWFSSSFPSLMDVATPFMASWAP